MASQPCIICRIGLVVVGLVWGAVTVQAFLVLGIGLACVFFAAAVAVMVALKMWIDVVEVRR